MREHGSKWYSIYGKIESNKKHLKVYQNEFDSLISTLAGISYDKARNSTIQSEEKYNRLELRMCKRRRIIPVTDASIICQVIYITPKRTKTYTAQRQIRMSSIFNRINAKSESQQSIEYQRSLMTSSKRYDIMRRDGFKCKLCGRTATDGAQLEVDHILAVSRGGKSIDSNLRTLCRECNQGKKAKVE
jgi:5-methylcytosine-specific restriction endonuclease McrA